MNYTATLPSTQAVPVRPIIRQPVTDKTVDIQPNDRPMSSVQINIGIETLVRELGLSRIDAANRVFAYTFGLNMR